jgi:hypothetical protein
MKEAATVPDALSSVSVPPHGRGTVVGLRARECERAAGTVWGAADFRQRPALVGRGHDGPQQHTAAGLGGRGLGRGALHGLTHDAGGGDLRGAELGHDVSRSPRRSGPRAATCACTHAAVGQDRGGGVRSGADGRRMELPERICLAGDAGALGLRVPGDDAIRDRVSVDAGAVVGRGRRGGALVHK